MILGFFSTPLGLLRLAVFFIFGLAIIATGLSDALEESNSKFALVLNPLNIEASSNEITRSLADEKLRVNLDRLLAIAEAAVRFAPRDARALSLQAEILKRQGHSERANKLYTKVLLFAPTEINALLNRLSVAAKAGDHEEAVKRIDLILRRWSQYYGQVMPTISAVLQRPEGRVRMKGVLSNRPPWRGRLMASLAKTAPGRAFFQQLLLEEQAAGKPPSNSELKHLMHAYIRSKEPEKAYRLFLFTLTPEENKHLGFIYNSHFQLGSTGNPFDWNVSRSSDADIRMLRDDNLQGLSVRFLNNPSKLGNISQLLKLHSGNFRLTATASATHLKVPKNLRWVVRCTDGGFPLVELSIPGGTYALKEFHAYFDVPPEKCSAQRITLRTGVTTKSWRNRYSGTVIFREVSIENEPRSTVD